jgi:hypothetical protein
VYPDASALHNQLAQLTRVGDSTYNVPEIEDEMFSETTTVVATRPMEARQVVMQGFEKVKVRIVDVDALLNGMVGLELWEIIATFLNVMRLYRSLFGDMNALAKLDVGIVWMVRLLGNVWDNRATPRCMGIGCFEALDRVTFIW